MSDMIKQFMKDRKGSQKIRVDGISAITIDKVEGDYHLACFPGAEIAIGGHVVTESAELVFLVKADKKKKPAVAAKKAPVDLPTAKAAKKK
jgi:hypothetical protein